MEYLEIVFMFIKEHFKEAATHCETCFVRLEKIKVGNDIFPHVYSYALVLQDLGLITCCMETGEIILTSKGMDPDSVVKSL